MTALPSRLLLAVLLLAATTACINDDSDFEQLAANTIQPVEVTLDYSELDEEPDVVPTDINDPFYNDYIENDDFTRLVTITFGDGTVSLTGATNRVNVSTDGAHVTIRSLATRMHFLLTGTAPDGSFKIYSDNKFQLTLDGLNLTNPQGAAINLQCSKTCCLVLADGTENTLADGPTSGGLYPSETDDEDMKGALFSEGQIAISGKGTLNINAIGKHALASDDYLRLRPGCHINLSSTAGHGIKANDGVYIDGGMINISVSADGAKGVKSDSIVSIVGGRTCIITTGGSRIEYDETLGVNDTTGCAGVKADSLFTITGGELRALSSGAGGKGINAGTATIAGGKVTIVTTGLRDLSSPKGIKTTGATVLSGGYTYSYSATSVPVDANGGLIIADGYTTLDQHTRRLIVEF